MKACYAASFQGMGEAKPYFERFGHPTHHMTHVAINGALPRDVGTGFAEVQEWEFEATCHPCLVWKAFCRCRLGPDALLAFLVESGLLKTVKVREAIFSFGKQTEVWLSDGRDEACSVIGKFTQGSVADGKRLIRTLVIDQGELDFLIRNMRQSGILVGAPQKCPLGHILTYYDWSQPQYTHLRASMLAYARINVPSMLSRFTPDEAVRVATDSIYVRKSALKRLEEVEAFIPMKKCDCRCAFPVCSGRSTCPRSPQPNGVIRTRSSTCPWNMQLTSPSLIISSKKDLSPSTAQRHDNPLSRHLSGGGGRTKPRQRSSSSAREIPSSSPRPIAWPKGYGPGASRPRPTTVSSDGVARRSVRLKG